MSYCNKISAILPYTERILPGDCKVPPFEENLIGKMLPPELLDKILGQLKNRRDIQNAALVNHAWQKHTIEAYKHSFIADIHTVAARLYKEHYVNFPILQEQLDEFIDIQCFKKFNNQSGIWENEIKVRFKKHVIEKFLAIQNLKDVNVAKENWWNTYYFIQNITDHVDMRELEALLEEKCLEEAISYADTKMKRGRRDLGLKKVAEAFLKQENSEKALEVANMVEDYKERTSLICDICASFTKKGEKERALRLAHGIDGYLAREQYAFVKIAKALLEMEDIDGAIEIADGILHNDTACNNKDFMLMDICRRLMKMRDKIRAEEILERMTVSWMKEILLDEMRFI